MNSRKFTFLYASNKIESHFIESINMFAVNYADYVCRWIRFFFHLFRGIYFNKCESSSHLWNKQRVKKSLMIRKNSESIDTLRDLASHEKKIHEIFIFVYWSAMDGCNLMMLLTTISVFVCFFFSFCIANIAFECQIKRQNHESQNIQKRWNRLITSTCGNSQDVSYRNVFFVRFFFRSLAMIHTLTRLFHRGSMVPMYVCYFHTYQSIYFCLEIGSRKEKKIF